ncbi:hypothetical protein PAXRUDRAFT_275412 [Paxillus rubicundulus Ve08.2h10]|uniref:Uncharacterized protein n=1 Tax=Paxillus rubicundulus Ve08.2h10 TaxID=930991 RepID=A0A0D0D7A5_9AGAM|nr:hypothetical protein PAXRUDRAFT_275412 [Paxillus rubicundulus Ve08.2h10]
MKVYLSRKSVIDSVSRNHWSTRSSSYTNSLVLSQIPTSIYHWKCLYLDELQDELQLKRCVHTTLPTLSRALQHLGVSCKIISTCAYE